MILPFTFGLALGLMIAGVFVVALIAEREWTAELEEVVAAHEAENLRKSVPVYSSHIVPMSVREVEDAEMERQIRMHMENYPVRKERHLFAVDNETARIYQLPMAPGGGNAA
jgi:uncharacterized protein (DUF58 family)